MKVTKHYEQGVIILYLIEGDTSDRIVLDNDQQMRRLGECLIDLERTGAREVIIEPKQSVTNKTINSIKK